MQDQGRDREGAVPRAIALVGDAADLTRQHFGPLAALALGPAALQAGLLAAINKALTGAWAVAPEAMFDPVGSVGSLNALLALLLGALVGESMTVVSQGCVVVAVADACAGRPVDVGVALRRCGARLGPLFGAVALVHLGVIGGLLLAVVPGVLLGLRWAFVFPTVLLEAASPRQALARSWRLSVGHRRLVAVLWLLLMALSALGAPAAGRLVQAVLPTDPDVELLRAVLVQVVLALPWLLHVCAVTLLYVRARGRTPAGTAAAAAAAEPAP